MRETLLALDSFWFKADGTSLIFVLVVVTAAISLEVGLLFPFFACLLGLPAVPSCRRAGRNKHTFARLEACVHSILQLAVALTLRRMRAPQASASSG